MIFAFYFDNKRMKGFKETKPLGKILQEFMVLYTSAFIFRLTLNKVNNLS